MEDDFEVHAPSWIGEIFGEETKFGFELAQQFTTVMGLNQLLKRNVLCDVNIKVENTEFPAHKAVLASASRYFRTMFTSGFQESREPDICITGKPEAFKIILDSIYSGELSLTVETVLDVLEMSHYLQLDLVMKRCEQYLCEECFLREKCENNFRLDAKVAILSMAAAKVYGLEDLSDSARQCIARNFSPTDSFLDLMTIELLEEVVSEKDLNDEKQVYDTTLAWLQHDWENRKQFAPALFRKIRLGIVPIGHLSLTIIKYPDLFAIKECRELIEKVLEMYDARKTGDAPLHFTEPELFSTRTMINAIIGIDTQDYNHYYDIDTKGWEALTKFPSLPVKDNNNNGDSCVSTNGHLYVSRGTASSPRKLKCPQFLRLDMPNNRWLPLQPMNKRRKKTRLVAGSGKIYAIGGDVEDHYRMISCEVYDIHTNTWTSLPSLTYDNGYGYGFHKPAIELCKVYRDKLLVYYRLGRASNRMMYIDDPHIPEKHFLKMYDPVTRVWTTLMDDMHPSQQTIKGLIINDDKCYRIFCCKCNVDEECRNTDISVQEIIIDFDYETALIGETQEQDLITGVSSNEKKMAFRVNQDVYVVYNNKQFFKTGIKIARNHTDPIKLDRWKNLKQVSLQGVQSVLFAQHMFDKEKWL